jgi:hypothetical protein
MEISGVRPSEICCKRSTIFICWPIDFKLTHKHYIRDSLSSKLGKIRSATISNWYLEDFRPDECDSDKFDLKMAAIAAIYCGHFGSYFQYGRQNT